MKLMYARVLLIVAGASFNLDFAAVGGHSGPEKLTDCADSGLVLREGEIVYTPTPKFCRPTKCAATVSF